MAFRSCATLESIPHSIAIVNHINKNERLPAAPKFCYSRYPSMELFYPQKYRARHYGFSCQYKRFGEAWRHAKQTDEIIQGEQRKSTDKMQ